jgi:hypothetical protein
MRQNAKPIAAGLKRERDANPEDDRLNPIAPAAARFHKWIAAARY